MDSLGLIIAVAVALLVLVGVGVALVHLHLDLTLGLILGHKFFPYLVEQSTKKPTRIFPAILARPVI